ncbi:hypothetical protein LUZ61_002056 [Rhynchospora tenuis]|uniref:ACT domain-containing protein ACR n=1 Tax=Rhynchospora tenuis TaxID=198213 RepID=A0AAD6ERG1_9POAL|nr:hypothetical protein LUZ61_002056 [Rhynchospora tenuis]
MEACCPYFDPDYENLNQRINGPRVTVDNESCENCTVIKVNSLTEQDLLLEVLQVLTDMDLCINKSYISSDAGWFMDVFHVKDQNGNKVHDKSVISYIQQAIGAIRIHQNSESRKQKEVTLSPKLEQNSLSDCTEIEMIGPNRPGIFSEISAVLAEQRCNIVEAHAWTHNDCLACVAKISSDEPTSPQISDPTRLATIKDHLSTVLHNGGVKARFLGCNNTVGQADAERRLHQLMFARRDFDQHYYSDIGVGKRTMVSVDRCNEKRYSVVNVECLDRPRLMFDTVCTLADLHYVVFHASISSHGPFASQEYYIRHKDGRILDSTDEKQLVVKCLEAAIERRICEGVRLELCTENNPGLLSYITRVLRENGLTVAHADIETNGENATNVLYVQDISGNSNIDLTVLEAIRKQLDPLAFEVKHYEVPSLSSSPRRKSSSSPERDAFSFVSLLRSKIERFISM